MVKGRLFSSTAASWMAPVWQGVYSRLKKDGYTVAVVAPPAQRQMSARAGSTVEEASGSHAIYVSQPDAVAEIIERAASQVKPA